MYDQGDLSSSGPWQKVKGHTMSNPRRAFYTSSNGDCWLVVKAGNDDEIFVRHEPNQASGGQASEVDIATFIAHGIGSPESKALMDLLALLRSEQDREDMERLAADKKPANDDGSTVLHP